MKRIAIPCLILLLSFACNISFGQKVKAILVKLYSEQNRIRHFESKGDLTNANYVREDAKKIIDVTIKDFENNFDHCPVYYFMDTDIDKVLSNDLTGILLDKDQQPVSNAVLQKGDTNFYIVYYGIPDDVLEDKRDGTIYKSGFYPTDGLVVLGHDNKRMRWVDHFLLPPALFRKYNKNEAFYSKRFGMGYRPYARVLQYELAGHRAAKQQRKSSQ